MRRVGGWLGRGTPASASTRSLNALSESQDLEDAMRAATLIMNDDVEGAEKGLSKGNSAFHKLGLGVITFMRATLGFEQDVMKEASERLADAETTATNDHHRVRKHGGASRSDIYANGSEFALAAAEAQIMAAVVGVLNESLTESLRGFYKLRKAYATLQTLLDMEVKYAKALSRSNVASKTDNSTDSLVSMQTVGSAAATTAKKPTHPPSLLQQSEVPSSYPDGTESDQEEFFDASEDKDEAPTPTTYTGHVALDGAEKKLSDLETSSNKSEDESASSLATPASPATPYQHKPMQSFESPSSPVSQITAKLLVANPDSPVFSNPIDTFIHSGIDLCFGLLQLLLSTIPPAFSKLLYIIGFNGDKETGLLLVWEASKFHDVHGGLAALCLMAWYHAFVGSSDIVPEPPPDSTPETQIEGYPTLRLHALAESALQRFPKSQLWVLEKARMAASQRQLSTALGILEKPCMSPLKQVAALHMFEKSLNAMHSHRHTLCAESFRACVDLNSWSPALYLYIVGASHLQLYRKLRKTSPSEAEKHAQEAETHFKEAPTHAGKKKIMARQLPFDVFVTRKIQKWEQRSKEWGIPFIDAIGVAPTEEMIFLWNGYKKMNSRQLRESLEILSWSDNPNENPTWMREGLDEKAILALLRSAALRNLRRHEEAKVILKREIISHPKLSFKGPLKDEWTAPTAHHEMGVNLWMERSGYQREYGTKLVDTLTVDDVATVGGGGGGMPTITGTDFQKDSVPLDIDKDRTLVAECKEYIEKVRTWERFELESRIGIKVTSAVDAIAKWEKKYGKAG